MTEIRFLSILVRDCWPEKTSNLSDTELPRCRVGPLERKTDTKHPVFIAWQWDWKVSSRIRCLHFEIYKWLTTMCAITVIRPRLKPAAASGNSGKATGGHTRILHNLDAEVRMSRNRNAVRYGWSTFKSIRLTSALNEKCIDAWFQLMCPTGCSSIDFPPKVVNCGVRIGIRTFHWIKHGFR